MTTHPCVADAARRETAILDWGRLDWLVTGAAMPGAELTFGLVTIKPGERNPLHSHPNCEEVLYVVSGRCEHRLGDEILALEAGSAIRIPRGVPHWARCVGDEPLQAIIAFSSGDRRADLHEEQGVA